ncbi:uncharacterized protein LOC103967586 isoform X2 [Pyrus x bretschneideri]|uniref:uncharacterized protein LOC103967586 isoform X2 n=1 Tax=Pyrus x bretschneideri TaxID=225117 RepID=UPI00202DD1A2|nr:uncharacterized protein LOC103967586 isoform X2 [Pyrus x bretschneideri]
MIYPIPDSRSLILNPSVGSKKAYIYKNEKEKKAYIWSNIVKSETTSTTLLLFGMEGVGKKKTSASSRGHRTLAENMLWTGRLLWVPSTTRRLVLIVWLYSYASRHCML